MPGLRAISAWIEIAPSFQRHYNTPAFLEVIQQIVRNLIFQRVESQEEVAP
jgi:hypothetical protein